MMLLLPLLLGLNNFLLTQQVDVARHLNWNKLPDACGKSIHSFRIVGGQESSLGQYPWIARLGYERRRKLEFSCGGSIISETVIVTAAHCLADGDWKKLRVIRVGENYADEHPDCEEDICAPDVQDLPIKEVIVHKHYDPKTFHNDIALVKLKQPIRFNQFVQPICLPQDELLEPHYIPKGNLEVAGWGFIDNTRKHIPNKLMYVSLPVVSPEVCQDLFHVTNDNYYYCIGVGGGKDSCIGDSGGPVMKQIRTDEGRKYFLLGLVSFGNAICGKDAAIYTKIAFYIRWIIENLD